MKQESGKVPTEVSGSRGLTFGENKMSKISKLVMLAAVAMFAISFAGCGNGAPSEEETKKVEEMSKKAQEAKATTPGTGSKGSGAADMSLDR